MKVVVMMFNIEAFCGLKNWEMSINKDCKSLDFETDFIKFKTSDEVRFTYPGVKKCNNWYMQGLVPKNDYSMDLRDYYSIEFDIKLEKNRIYEVNVGIGLLQFVNIDPNNENISTAKWNATIVGKKSQHVSVPFNQFDDFKIASNPWKYARDVSISLVDVEDGNDEENKVVLSKIGFKRRKSVYISSPVLSKSANAGETITYKFNVLNCENRKQAISFFCEKRGIESMQVSLKPEALILEPGELAICDVTVEIGDNIAPGGYEKQIIYAVPDGKGNDAETISFLSMRYLPHPYIIHTENEWQKVKRKSEKYEWARDLLDFYTNEAEKWEPVKAGHDKPYMFITHHAHFAMNAAFVWKLTGRIEFAEKIVKFLRMLIDPDNGYTKTMRASHQQLVHEGEFFKSTAIAYDLIHDLDILTKEDHRNIETTFRAFMDLIDWSIDSGDNSNWTLAEIAGATYCSQALQDRERMIRFIYGNCGFTDHLSKGVLDDGWWYECATGYNLLAAGLFSEISNSAKPWGINLADIWVPANYSDRVDPVDNRIDGLNLKIWGGNKRNYRTITDLWDSLLPFADYRNVISGVNDASETKLLGITTAFPSFDSRYDIAYYLYGKPEYADVLKKCEPSERDLLFGLTEVENFPEVESMVHLSSAYADNAGVAVLRSQKQGRDSRQQIQACVKYGIHGGAHGHYDRTSLMSIMRYGRSFYNPENIWYSYGTFMYKFYVQNSITHNMVTVDLKLQDPVEGKRLLFHSGELFQACAMENKARWSNPPYGGWRVNDDPDFATRAWNEGRYVPIPDNPPDYTKRSDFTEVVLQRRLTIVTDDYVVNFDYAKAEQEHKYDCLYHIKGLREFDAKYKRYKGSSDQLTANPLSSGQFITNCEWYEVETPSRASFEMGFGEDSDNRANRTECNEDGILKMDLYAVWPHKAEVVIGCDPEYDAWGGDSNYVVEKQLWYEVIGDSKILTQNKFGAWILGRDDLDIEVSGIKELKLKVKIKNVLDDNGFEKVSKKTIFFGDPYLVTSTGEKKYLAGMDLKFENIDQGNGIGVDYYGGPVKIAGKLFEKSIPANPDNIDEYGIITLSLEDLNAVKFVASIGGDYPLGNEDYRRRTISTRVTGKTAKFITIVEPYEDNKMIEKVEAINETKIKIYLRDGRCQVIEVQNLDNVDKDISIEMKEYTGERLLREEKYNNTP